MAGYSVRHQHGCRIIAGPVPLDELVALLEVWQRDGEEWVVDATLSQALGATLVCGPRIETQAWRARLGLRRPHDAQVDSETEEKF